MPHFNLELLFAYIRSKRGKLGMFIFYDKSQFIYPNKVNLPPIRQFPSFSTFGHERYGARRPQDLLLSRSSRERYCHSIKCSEYTFDPGLKPLEFFGS